MPLYRQGRCRFRLERTTPQLFAAGQNVASWEVARFDDVGGWNGSTSYVFDRPGLWFLHAVAHRGAAGAAASSQIRVRINGAAIEGEIVPSTISAVTAQVTALWEVSAGDTADVQVQLSGSAALSLSEVFSAFEGVRVGPKAWTG